MSERWAICYNDTIENICLWDGVTRSEENPTAWTPPEGAILRNVSGIHCDIGWTWDGSTFNAPPPVEDLLADGDLPTPIEDLPADGDSTTP